VRAPDLDLCSTLLREGGIKVQEGLRPSKTPYKIFRDFASLYPSYFWGRLRGASAPLSSLPPLLPKERGIKGGEVAKNTPQVVLTKILNSGII
jgi:hypothetical protein